MFVPKVVNRSRLDANRRKCQARRMFIGLCRSAKEGGGYDVSEE